jgi:hypothetical protein
MNYVLCRQHFEIDARAMLHKTGECKSELGEIRYDRR